LEEEPEKKPRERKRDARNREHQRKRAREGGEQRPRDTWRWRRDAGTRIRQRRGERESVPRRWKDRRVAHRAERGAAHSRPRHAEGPRHDGDAGEGPEHDVALPQKRKGRLRILRDATVTVRECRRRVTLPRDSA